MALLPSKWFKFEKKAVLNFTGFILILIGIISFIIILLRQEFPSDNQKIIENNAGMLVNEVPILFFITMLGFVFLYPETLMAPNKTISSLRICVFMLINVICMILLKVGWKNDGLKAIGLDWYWISAIAFVFGGKVAQTYFENVAPPSANNDTNEAATNSTQQQSIAKLALDQYKDRLKAQFPNISAMSDAVHELNGILSHVITIYLKDNNAASLPPSLKVLMPDDTIKTIATEIVTNVGTPKIQRLQDGWVTATGINEAGSVCCLVASTDNKKFRGAVTSGHIYSNGAKTSEDGIITDSTKKTNVLLDNQVAGQWYLQEISIEQDMAVFRLNNDFNAADHLSFSDHHIIDDSDVKKRTVTLISSTSKERSGYILDYNISQDIPYDDGWTTISHIIYIGNNADRDKSKSVSIEGDSGGCVYTLEGAQRKLIGIILGGDEKFTYVLPLKNSFEQYNLKLL